MEVESEKNISGNFLIDTCVDIIQPPEFMQKLELVRAKYST